MKHMISHFAIYVDKLERASKFYTNVFDWEITGYGSSDFSQITSTEGSVIGALQHRKYELTHEHVIGYECSIAVDNMEKTAESIIEAGGTILMPKTEIPNVGWLIKFKDTEGNIACAIQYHSSLSK